MIKMDERFKSEVAAVKRLGDAIGYGNMMTVASALWRKSLEEKGYPISGAFTIKGDTQNEIDRMDSVVKEALK